MIKSIGFHYDSPKIFISCLFKRVSYLSDRKSSRSGCAVAYQIHVKLVSWQIWDLCITKTLSLEHNFSQFHFKIIKLKRKNF